MSSCDSQTTHDDHNLHPIEISSEESAYFSSITHRTLVSNSSTSYRITASKSNCHDLLSTTPIREALHKCSLAMGVTNISVLEIKNTFMKVLNKAENFLKQIRLLLPQNFSTEYKNPCWQAEQTNFPLNDSLEKLMTLLPTIVQRKLNRYAHLMTKQAHRGTEDKLILCLPYFFLAGFPKSATTTIHTVLVNQSQILAPYVKEPHWWTRKHVMGCTKACTKDITTSFMLYTLNFRRLSLLVGGNGDQSMNDQLITFDGSQSMLWDSHFFVDGQDFCAMPAVISKVLPNAKFIVVMRNPVTRLFSHFLYSCQYQYGLSMDMWPPEMKREPAELFHNGITKDIEMFNKCINNSSVFECVSSISANTHLKEEGSCPKIRYRLTVGLYAVHIRKWLQFFPIHNFLFLKMEDITKDSYATMRSITDFLGIEAVPRDIAAKLLHRRENGSPIHVPTMLTRSLKLLEDFYHPYNRELAKLLNNDRFLWEDEVHLQTSSSTD